MSPCYPFPKSSPPRREGQTEKGDKETKGMNKAKINLPTALAKARHSPPPRSAAEEGLGDPDADGVPCGKPGTPGSKGARGAASASPASQPSFVLILCFVWFFFYFAIAASSDFQLSRASRLVHYPKPQQPEGTRPRYDRNLPGGENRKRDKPGKQQGSPAPSP